MTRVDCMRIARWKAIRASWMAARVWSLNDKMYLWINSVGYEIDKTKFQRGDSMLTMADVIFTCIFFHAFCYSVLFFLFLPFFLLFMYFVLWIFLSTLETLVLLFVLCYCYSIVFHANTVKCWSFFSFFRGGAFKNGRLRCSCNSILRICLLVGAFF